jgi:serine/threonine-protein kinase
VAVKAFRLDVVPEISAQLADILKRMAAAPIKHPAVVGVLDAGLEGTTAFLAMEYVAAETLDVSLRRIAPVNLATAVPMLRQVAEALEAGWAAGMSHGALHPRDIFVLPPAAEHPHAHAVIRVSGFGVTDALEELRIPTPVRRPYTAPERAHFGDRDIRSDVYSLGVIAHELLTGRRPADSLQLDAELPEATSPDQALVIRHALSGALAVNSENRFATPMAFVDALASEVVAEPAVEPVALLPVEQVEPSPVEPDSEHREPDADAESNGEDAQVQPVEPEVEPDRQSIWIPEPEPEHEPEPEPERVPARSSVAPPAFLGAPSQTDRRAPFQPFIDAPKENAMPRMVGVAAIALAVGTGFGYWLRGPEPAARVAPLEVKSPAEVTPASGVSKDEPIGTDVAVTDPAKAVPAPKPASAPEAPAAAAAEPAATRGRLLVRSVPAGGSVTINGRGSGTTPATIRDLPFGTHSVAVSRSGYQRREQRVTISRTIPAREITLELAAVNTAPPAGRAPAPGATTGSVLVETRPTGAAVTIDGRSVGTAPVRVPELTPGSHTVRVSLARHKTVNTTAVVRAGQQTLVRLSLEIQ